MITITIITIIIIIVVNITIILTLVGIREVGRRNVLLVVILQIMIILIINDNDNIMIIIIVIILLILIMLKMVIVLIMIIMLIFILLIMIMSIYHWWQWCLWEQTDNLLVLIEGSVVLIGAMPRALFGRWCWVESSTPLSVSENIWLDISLNIGIFEQNCPPHCWCLKILHWISD